MNECRILSFDGGGVRGAFSARLIQRLVEQQPELLAHTSVVAGTSTGALLALGIASGLGPSKLVQLYAEKARDIFRRRLLGGVWGPLYSAEGLLEVLGELFGRRTVGTLQKFVVVPAYDLDGPADPANGRPRAGRARFFRTGVDDQQLVVDVAAATCAAPVYFPAYKGFVDGGLVANNPSTCAAAQALDWGFGRDNLRVLSIGTGRTPSWIDGESNAWGALRWAPKLPGIMIDAVAGVADYQLRQVLGDQAHRLEADLERPVDLDDVDAIPYLLEAADKVDLAPTLAWLASSGWVPTGRRRAS